MRAVEAGHVAMVGIYDGDSGQLVAAIGAMPGRQDFSSN